MTINGENDLLTLLAMITIFDWTDLWQCCKMVSLLTLNIKVEKSKFPLLSVFWSNLKICLTSIVAFVNMDSLLEKCMQMLKVVDSNRPNINDYLMDKYMLSYIIFQKTKHFLKLSHCLQHPSYFSTTIFVRTIDKNMFMSYVILGHLIYVWVIY